MCGVPQVQLCKLNVVENRWREDMDVVVHDSPVCFIIPILCLSGVVVNVLAFGPRCPD